MRAKLCLENAKRCRAESFMLSLLLDLWHLLTNLMEFGSLSICIWKTLWMDPMWQQIVLLRFLLVGVNLCILMLMSLIHLESYETSMQYYWTRITVTGLVKTLQAVNGTTWHNAFLGLWIAALRLVQRVRTYVNSFVIFCWEKNS